MQKLSGIKLLVADALAAEREDAVVDVATDRGMEQHAAQIAEFVSHVAGLLPQLACGSGHDLGMGLTRRGVHHVLLVDAAGRQLEDDPRDARTELTDAYDLPVVRDGDDAHGVMGRVQVVRSRLGAVRQREARRVDRDEPVVEQGRARRLVPRQASLAVSRSLRHMHLPIDESKFSYESSLGEEAIGQQTVQSRA